MAVLMPMGNDSVDSHGLISYNVIKISLTLAMLPGREQTYMSIACGEKSKPIMINIPSQKNNFFY